uniref:Uncharacterized protein n=1 Tax=Parascaris equorum TaxID=6256 RepID=A0A914R0C3_PAREQ
MFAIDGDDGCSGGAGVTAAGTPREYKFSCSCWARSLDSLLSLLRTSDSKIHSPKFDDSGSSA